MTHEHVLQSPPCLNLNLPTIVADNCKQAKLLLVKYDAGQGGKKKIPILSGSHCSMWVCIVTGMFQILKVDEKHPNRHVTAAAVGSLLQEYISRGAPIRCEERCWESMLYKWTMA